MKALVTGASGFVGSHLVERLVREGVEVVCQVRETRLRRSYGGQASRPDWLEGLPVERRVADLGDAESLARAVRGVDYVFHVAALLRARTERAYNAVNVEGTRNLLEAAERACPDLRRFVYVGSLASAGPCQTPQPLDESADTHPISFYGTSKLAAERLVLDAGNRMPAAVVRPPAVYGPRDTSFLSLFAIARRYGIVPVIGSPSKELTLAYVTDVVDCLWRTATADAARGQVYFVGSGTHTWREVGNAVEQALGRRLRRPRMPAILARLAGEFGELKWTLTGTPQVICRRKINDVLQQRWTCSWAKATRELDYAPQVTLNNGMRETVRWYEGTGWLKPRR